MRALLLCVINIHYTIDIPEAQFLCVHANVRQMVADLEAGVMGSKA